MPLDDLTLTSRQQDGAIGRPLDRIDGRAKVTGAAHYAAEYPADGLLYGVGVQSAVAKGRLATIDAAAAEAAPGVVRVFTHENAPKMKKAKPDPSETRFTRPVPVLQGDKVAFNGAYVALVVARTFEEARHAADLIRITYAAERPETDMHARLDHAEKPSVALGANATDASKGDFDQAFAQAPVTVDATYETPGESNAPMEPHATTALWDGERLTLFDATQAPNECRTAVAKTFGLKEDQVRVVVKFIGGGFGSKYQAWGHVTMAAMATMALERPVRVVVSRRQMFTATGHRPPTIQRVRFGAGADGAITAFAHDSFLQTSAIDTFCEQASAYGRPMYAGDNRRTTHRVVPLDLPTPNIMRAPGECPGSFAVESAVDELAVALRMDPIALRLKNEPAKDPETDQPFSSRSLVQCLTAGAERFGWARRDPRPRRVREGRTLVGYGVAGSSYPSGIGPAEARVRLTADGRARVQTSASDLGTGTWTVLAQVAADTLGLAPDQVEVEIGDTDLPKGRGSGGSRAAASCGSAVLKACETLRDKLVTMARGDTESPAYKAPKDAIVLRDGQLRRTDGTGGQEPVAALLARHAADLPLEASGKIRPGLRDLAHMAAPQLVDEGYSMHAYGAQFAEVGVDADTGVVRLRRMLGVFACGRILNAKTARSQLLGGMIMGAGMALMEEAFVDARFGHFVNHDLADYHVPVQLDVGAIDAVFLPETDDKVNPLGAKGVGEIGIVGAAAAIANAVYHATGVRVRALPLTMDKLLADPAFAPAGA